MYMYIYVYICIYVVGTCHIHGFLNVYIRLIHICIERHVLSAGRIEF